MSKVESGLNNELPVDDDPYNPHSQRLIEIQQDDGTSIQITIDEWNKRLGTNGRGGT